MYFILIINSKRNLIINEVNWNILLTSGKEIKRDSMISVNKNRLVYIISKMIIKLFEFYGEPSSKAKYNT